jgi:DNA polymerase-3 subunit beta
VKIKTETAALKAALTLIRRHTAPKAPMAALGAVLIESENGDGGHPRLYGTDLETAAIVRLPGIVSESPEAATVKPAGVWPVAVPVKELAAIVRKTKAPTVTLESESPEARAVTVKAGGATVTLAGIDPENMPAIPETAGFDGRFRMTVETLRELAPATYAASVDETRYNLNGLHIVNLDGGRIRWETTDGHRLARAEAVAEAPWPMAIDAETGKPRTDVIAPAGFSRELTRLALARKPAAEAVYVSAPTAETVAATFGPVTITGRLIDGKFPNTDQVIPEASSCRPSVTLNRTETLDAAERVTAAAPKNRTGLKVTVNGALILETAARVETAAKAAEAAAAAARVATGSAEAAARVATATGSAEDKAAAEAATAEAKAAEAAAATAEAAAAAEAKAGMALASETVDGSFRTAGGAEEIVFGVNGPYLIGALKAATVDYVTVSFSDTKPATDPLRVDGYGETVFSVVMPMRL